MKADLVSLDAVRAERAQRITRAPVRLTADVSATATPLLVGAALASIACGIVAAVLWFVWMLAEIVP